MKRVPASILLLLVVAIACDSPIPADLIVVNAEIYTVDSLKPHATAMAVKDGRFLAVGTEEEMEKYLGSETRRIDLNGQFVMPGFIEGHGHYGGLGQMKMELDLLTTSSWQEVEAIVKEKIKTNPYKWLFGRGWHQEKWDSLPDLHTEGYPDAATMDTFSQNTAVVLKHASGHAVFANSAAMKLSGVSKETPDPEGGRILRNEYGQPTGVFEENAQYLITDHYDEWRASLDPDIKREIALEEIKLAENECLAHGITSFQDAGSKFDVISLYRSLSEENHLRVRLWVMLRERYDDMKDRMDGFPYIQPENTFFTCRALKTEIDGALGSYGAWLLEAYADKPGFHGQNTRDITEVGKIADLALDYGMQLCIHAIGDRGNQMILDLIESKTKGNGQDLRWRMEHAQHLHPEDIPRFARLGLIASMQSVHCTSDAPFVVKRLGTDRARDGAYVWQSLLQSGAVVSNGTDVPVEKIDPFANYYAAITRKRTDDTSAFFSEQVMTREQAIYSMTMACAYAAFEEHIKGSISRGKLADFIILDRNLITCDESDILNTEVLATYVGGQKMFAR